ncbi:MAG: glucuronate isomerase [Planctomycetota bacterium]
MSTTAAAPYITDDFLLSNETARSLYHDYAAAMPIYDYHCHLPPEDLAANRAFDNLYDVWLAGDHYKWRAMRHNGVPESHCTGDADPYDKFLAFARTVPQTLRNPLHHWTHLELRRYFAIDVLLSEDTAKEVWDEANRQLKQMRVGDILDRFNVALIGTTDDPTDSLEHHKKLADDPAILPHTAVYPAFRPDKLYNTTDPVAFAEYCDGLAGGPCETLGQLLDAIDASLARFAERGCRLSDHGLTHIPHVEVFQDVHETDRVYRAAREGTATADELRRYQVAMLLHVAQRYHDLGWASQYHLGAMRNNNGWAFEHLGPDTGYDSIGDFPQGAGLSSFLGELARRNALPRTVLYNLNPADNYLFATMTGNYVGAGDTAGQPGRMQFGSGWWFLDQKEGMTWQINALSNLGLLTRFVGMLTDSRSFLSYPRHEYFRRLLCDIFGRDAEAGEVPNDLEALGKVVRDISFNNARDYFGMALKGRHA